VNKKEMMEEYHRDYVAYMKLPGAEKGGIPYPRLGEKTSTTRVDGYYFRQDTWAFKRVLEIRPKSMVDIGSAALLVGIFSMLCPTTSFDVRPINVSLPNLDCRKASIINLPLADNSVDLLSNLCVLEHIGLGRYGDKLDPLGSVKALKEISRVLRPGGHFLLGTNISHTFMLRFNAHRIFTKHQILAELPKFSIVEEIFLFPGFGTEEMVVKLQGTQFCVWCVDLIKKT